MPDRHWMEKWKWDHGVNPPLLMRRRDGRTARSWTEAADIEAEQRGITREAMLTDKRYQMVPLAELYPPEADVPPPPVRLGERREKKEQRAYAERMELLEAQAQDAVPEEDNKPSKMMLFSGWFLAVIAGVLFLGSGSLITGAVLVFAFFGGAGIATYIVKQ